jgi:hypothetical protein
MSYVVYRKCEVITFKLFVFVSQDDRQRGESDDIVFYENNYFLPGLILSLCKRCSATCNTSLSCQLSVYSYSVSHRKK